MNKIIQLIFLSSILINHLVSCGTASCSYTFTTSNEYICSIILKPSHDEIYNKSFPEIYNEISGEHNGGSDDLVTGLAGFGIESRTFSDSFCKKFKNLKKLLFSYSTINKLTEFSFNICENLEIVAFSTGEINWIGQDTFKTLRKLERLSISEAKLNHISEYLFKANKNLKELRFDSNRISLLNEKLLENQENLKILVLSYNKIEGFPKYFFKSLKSLELLDLQNNLIVNILAIWFETQSNLKELNLRNNLIEDLPKNVFMKQTKLEKLNLDLNLIKYIHYDSFQVLPTITRLMKNRIIGVDENFIRTLVNAGKSVLLDRNKCTEDSEILSEREEVTDEQVSRPDEIFLREIEPCFYSYVPRNENYQEDINTKLNILSEEIKLISTLISKCSIKSE